MGNMMFNRRLGTASDPDAELSEIYCLNLTFLNILLTLVHDEANYKKSEYRIFKQHMYGGPKGLGDPNYRELSKMEEDPMIPQRMRDITRTQLCTDEVRAFAECSKNNGFSMVVKYVINHVTNGKHF